MSAVPVYLSDISSVKLGSTNINKICRGAQELWPNYTDLTFYDYILNDDHSYFDIGVKPNWNHIYETKFCYTDSSQKSKWFAIFGACNSPATGRFHWLKNDSGYFAGGFYENSKSLRSFNTNVMLELTANAKTGRISYKIGNTSYSASYSGSGSGDINNYNIYLFTRNTGGQMDTDRNGVTLIMKFYYFKIYDATTNALLYDFEPAVYNVSAGFYDTVNKVFIQKSGTGTVQALND